MTGLVRRVTRSVSAPARAFLDARFERVEQEVRGAEAARHGEMAELSARLDAMAAAQAERDERMADHVDRVTAELAEIRALIAQLASVVAARDPE